MLQCNRPFILSNTSESSVQSVKSALTFSRPIRSRMIRWDQGMFDAISSQKLLKFTGCGLWPIVWNQFLRQSKKCKNATQNLNSLSWCRGCVNHLKPFWVTVKKDQKYYLSFSQKSRRIHCHTRVCHFQQCSGLVGVSLSDMHCTPVQLFSMSLSRQGHHM